MGSLYDLVPESMVPEVLKVEEQMRAMMPSMHPNLRTVDQLAFACVIALMRRVESGEDLLKMVEKLTTQLDKELGG